MSAMTQGQALVLDLPLPVVDGGHAHAVFDDQFSHANAAALSYPEAHWRQLEGPFLAGLPLTSTLALPTAEAPVFCFMFNLSIDVHVVQSNSFCSCHFAQQQVLTCD